MVAYSPHGSVQRADEEEELPEWIRRNIRESDDDEREPPNLTPDLSAVFGSGGRPRTPTGSERWMSPSQSEIDRIMNLDLEGMGGSTVAPPSEPLFDQAELDGWLERFGYRPGSSGGTGVDRGAVARQQTAIQESLDASLAHIADQFKRLSEELDRQKVAGLEEIGKARTQALASLVGLQEDFAVQSEKTDADILASVDRTRSAIGADAEAVLRDLEAQGASSAGVREAVASAQGQASNQGQIQGDLTDRLQEINSQYVDRNKQTTENIGQGASSDLSGNFATLMAGISQDRANQEFESAEQARQARLQLALNPPTRSWGGTPDGGLLSPEDTFLFEQAVKSGTDPDVAMINRIEGEPFFPAPQAPLTPNEWADQQIMLDDTLKAQALANRLKVE